MIFWEFLEILQSLANLQGMIYAKESALSSWRWPWNAPQMLVVAELTASYLGNADLSLEIIEKLRGIINESGAVESVEGIH